MYPLYPSLARLLKLSARPLQQRLEQAHQLSLNEWQVMAALKARPGSTASAVAEFTGLDKMAVSRALTTLKQHRRMQRRDDPTDQRSSRLYLTRVGQALLLAVTSDGQQIEVELLADAEAHAQLAALLPPLLAALTKPRARTRQGSL